MESKFKLTTKVEEQILKVQIKDTNLGKKKIGSVDLKGLPKQFDSIDQLAAHINKNEQHYNVNEEQNNLVVYCIATVGTKKKKMQCLKIKLEEVEQNSISILNQIQTRCNQSSDLQPQEIRKFFSSITQWALTFLIPDNIIQHIQNPSSRNLKQGTSQEKNDDNKEQKAVEKLKRQIEASNHWIKRQFQSFKQQLGSLNKQMYKIFEESKVAEISTESLQIYLKDTIQDLNDKLKLLFQINGMQSGQKLKILTSTPPPRQRNIEDFFSIYGEQKENYGMNNMKIVKVGSKGNNTGIVGKTPILDKNFFKILVLNTNNWGISVGIKDFLSKDIIKYGGNGWINNCEKTLYNQGKGLSSGDQIEVKVNRDAGSITWKVTNKNKNLNFETKCENEAIKDKGKFWVPLIVMSFNGDEIELIN